MRCCYLFFTAAVLLSTPARVGAQTYYTDVLVAGGGTGGTAAGIQAARLKVKTIIAEPTPWLGGMLTAAGVSATDGNHNLPSGLWEEFRQALYRHYGTKNLATGWVSHTLFEPHVGDSIFKALCAQEADYLKLLYGYTPVSVIKKGKRVTGVVFRNAENKTVVITAAIVIDATEAGDIMALSNTAYDLGTEDAAVTGEAMAPGNSNIIQDLTYAAILKDYGPGADKTIARPPNYDSTQFFKSCLNKFNTDTTVTKTTAEKMLQYGKIRNGKYMINWPPHGNDYYLNVIENTPEQRAAAYAAAKNITLQFVYFIQKDLGFRHLGLASDEFLTADGLPLIPYNRESRRLQGLARLTLNGIQQPYRNNLYKTGISVGDYPIDHHHDKNPAIKKIHFPPVPSYNIPLGALIPRETDGLIVAEKNASVSNLANGTTRLQPVVLLTGQAAGALAAWCALNRKQPRQARVRQVQQWLLNAGCYIMPYADVTPADTAWEAIQKTGAAGLIQGTGKPEGWANKTFFYPDSMMTARELEAAFKRFSPAFRFMPAQKDSVVDIKKGTDFLVSWLHWRRIQKKIPHKYPPVFADEWKQVLKNYYPGMVFTGAEPLTRRLFAILVNELAEKQFNIPVDWNGNLINDVK